MKQIFFFLNRKNKNKVKEFQFIESFEIKRIYPDKLRIKIFEKKPIAILQNKKEKIIIQQRRDNNF